jgi:2-polyprenyl-3-methyl-5-hydroxy-6-metoxy-1,4-benzoquinol methylase
MEKWIRGTVERILDLRPKRLLEIGCGTGLLLFRYCDHCESVHATDISAAALAGVRQEVARRAWSHVTLSQGDSLNVTVLDGKVFDTVVINSVVQYYPSRAYLEHVLERLWPHVEVGGKVFLGDIRNADLLSVHLCAVGEESHDRQGRGGGSADQGTSAASSGKRTAGQP